MATHSSILAWKIPWTEEPGYSSVGRKELDTTVGLSTPERMKQLGQGGNDAQFWTCLVVKVKSDFVKKKKQYFIGTWNIRFMN